MFAEASTSFVREVVDFRPALALDIGCGPGYTTRMLAEVTDAALVVGLDTSESFLTSATRTPRTAYVCANVTAGLPTRPPDLIYVRLVLAHLPDAAAVTLSWVHQLTPSGLLLLDEVEWIDTDNPVLARYEEIVVAMVAARGGPMYAGPLIADLVGAGFQKRADIVRRHDVTTADAARMYSMNLATWRHDPFVVSTYADAEIEELAAALQQLTRSVATGEIDWGLRQVAYEKTLGGR